jgi:hypothetical protein
MFQQAEGTGREEFQNTQNEGFRVAYPSIL